MARSNAERHLVKAVMERYKLELTRPKDSGKAFWDWERERDRVAHRLAYYTKKVMAEREKRT